MSRWLCPSWCWSPSPLLSVVRPAVAADQEALGLHESAAAQIQVADPLEAEHRIEDVERDHVDPVVGVGRAGRDEGAAGARLVDPLFQDLPSFASACNRAAVSRVDRFVAAADVGVDADLAEERLHPESARLVRDDRDDPRADLPCRAAASPACGRTPSSSTHPAIRRSRSGHSGEQLPDREPRAPPPRAARRARQEAAELPRAALCRYCISVLSSGGRYRSRRLSDLVVRDRDTEPRRGTRAALRRSASSAGG